MTGIAPYNAKLVDTLIEADKFKAWGVVANTPVKYVDRVRVQAAHIVDAEPTIGKRLSYIATPVRIPAIAPHKGTRELFNDVFLQTPEQVDQDLKMK